MNTFRWRAAACCRRLTRTPRRFSSGPPQVYEVPPGNSTNAYNLIDIDPLTGRATLREPKVQ